MSDSSTHTVSPAALRGLMVSLFTAAGCPDEAAQPCADVLYEADLRGYGSHGLLRLPNMIQRIENGMVDPAGRPRVVQEREGSALVDGGLSLGPVGAMYGAEVAIRKAKEAGCCAVGVINTNHICMAGIYVERIARAGLAGILTSVTQPIAHVMGGFERLLGTNPIAIAVPTGEGDPILVDFATTTISFGTVMNARVRGESIPEGTALGSGGEPITDPAEVTQGGAHPLRRAQGLRPEPRPRSSGRAPAGREGGKRPRPVHRREKSLRQGRSVHRHRPRLLRRARGIFRGRQGAPGRSEIFSPRAGIFGNPDSGRAEFRGKKKTSARGRSDRAESLGRSIRAGGQARRLDARLKYILLRHHSS